ncbi:MAG: hypothetical protein ABSC29_01030 [Minisyncoccia bacterium]|jgi:hypothetical protein
MDFAPVYLVQRFFYRLVDFFRHWYIDGSRAVGHRFITALEEADRSLAVKITLRYFFRPLYGDYTVVGRILGIVFRTGRILIGAVVYAVIAAFFLLFYLAWLAAPIVIIFYATRGL